MTADRLRQAARLMRERAEAATPGAWYQLAASSQYVAPTRRATPKVRCDEPSDAAHIAGMHPAVALAVADWLEGVAADWHRWPDAPALAVADAYLGESQ